MGNFFVGGTGKTPLSIYIYNLLKKRGWNPAIVRKYYDSHLDAVKEQLERVPYQFPQLLISDELSDIDTIHEDYFMIQNYNHYPKIKAPMIA